MQACLGDRQPGISQLNNIMILFDAHLDLAWNAIDWNRDLERSVAEIRALERCEKMEEKGRGCNTVALPELRKGRIAVCIATLLARLYRPGMNPPLQRYQSMKSAQAAAYGQLAYYRTLEQTGALRFIRDWPALAQHVQRWEAAPAEPEPLGFILSMEGADPILSPEELPQWWEAGLRIVGPAHYGISPYAHGTGTEGGLFPPGPAPLRAMEQVGMILDVTHLSDQCFDEALDCYGGPVLASHHNCRALVPGQRQLTDDQIRRLVARGTVIGTALDAWMLYPNWVRGQTRPQEAGVTLEAMIDHMDHVCQLAGDALHAAVGTDLDGGFGTEQTPADLDTIADLTRLPDLLSRRGYDAQAIQGMLSGNWLRFFRQAWSK
jgi:membrane dipeptidase